MLIAIISKEVYDKKFINKKHLNQKTPVLDYPTIKTNYILSILNRIISKGSKRVTMVQLSDSIKSSGLAYLNFEGNKRGIITGVAMPKSTMDLVYS